jgi:lipopolysaccharide transport system permease protein
VLNFAFGVVAGARPRGPSYFLFTFAGLLMWNLFSMTLNKTSLSLVGNSYLISKVFFPRLILPLSGTLATLLDFAVALGVLFVVQAFYGIVPEWQLLLVPVWVAMVLFLALGAGLIAAALTVQYRDIQHILPILIPFMLYASPVAYDVSQIPERYLLGGYAIDVRQLFYFVNPLAAPIVAFRASLLPTAPMPPLPYLVWSAAVALALFVLGAAVFKRTERRFADVV